MKSYGTRTSSIATHAATWATPNRSATDAWSATALARYSRRGTCRRSSPTANVNGIHRLHTSTWYEITAAHEWWWDSMLIWIWRPENAPNSGQEPKTRSRRRAEREIRPAYCPSSAAGGRRKAANGDVRAANGARRSEERGVGKGG